MFSKLLPWLDGFFEIVVLGFVLLLFLSLGSHNDIHYNIRLYYGAIIGFSFLFLSYKKVRPGIFLKPPFFFLVLFLGFQIVRVLWAYWIAASSGSQASTNTQWLWVKAYAQSGFLILIHFMIFVAAYNVYSRRSHVRRLINLMGWAGFIIGVAGIPSLLQGNYGYGEGTNQWGFLPKFFYFSSWVSEYIISRYTHQNWIGDVIALGFFPAVSLAVYSIEVWRDEKRFSEKTGHAANPLARFTSVLLYLLMVAVPAAVIFLVKSRGTLVGFLVGLAVYLVVLLLKYGPKAKFGLVLFMLLFLGGFAVWAGNLPLAIQELSTIQSDVKDARSGSLAETREGSNRAIGIFKEYPIWGVGRGGYLAFAVQFASPGTVDNPRFFMSRVHAMCHYFQILAEEGLGAVFYYLFILFFIGMTLKGLILISSRFQFFAGLSLFCALIMLWVHAGVSQILESYPLPMFIMLMTGAVMGILRADFDHEEG